MNIEENGDNKGVKHLNPRQGITIEGVLSGDDRNQ